MTKHDHPLFQWAMTNGRKIGWLARTAGMSHGPLTDYIHGRRPAPMPVKLAFQIITDGEVRAEDWPEVPK